MNNFEHFETRSFDLNLLSEMHNVPSKELSTNRITEILSVVTGQKLDNVMVSIIFSNAGLPLRQRAKVAPKAVEEKAPRITKANTVANLLGQLGIVNVTPLDETNSDGPDEEEMTDKENRALIIGNGIEDEWDVETEQENQYVDEVVENAQFFNRNVESIYTNSNGVDVV